MIGALGMPSELSLIPPCGANPPQDIPCAHDDATIVGVRLAQLDRLHHHAGLNVVRGLPLKLDVQYCSILGKRKLSESWEYLC